MENKRIAQKLVNILATLSSVPKKGYNKHQHYAYMREVDVMEALKAELVKNKMILLTSSKFVDLRERDKGFITTVETLHTFVDSESGEQMTVTSVGSGWDSTDKGAAKAITSSVKYALMKTFMISDEGSDIENDGESVVTSNQKPPKNPSFTTRFNSNKNSFKSEVVVEAGGSIPSTTQTFNTPNSTTQVNINPDLKVVNDTSRVVEKFNKPSTIKPTPNKSFSTTKPTIGFDRSAFKAGNNTVTKSATASTIKPESDEDVQF